MGIILGVTLLVACFTVILIFKLSISRDDVSSIPGPPSKSWLFGNLLEFVLGLPSGKTEFGWMSKYGMVHRFKACFGQERLMVSDPTALRYILSNPTLFVKSPSHQLINLVAFGEGSLLHAKGEVHSRIRSVMNPMFSAANVRALTPILEKAAQDLSERWESVSGSVIDVYRAMHNTSLQAVGEGIMGHDIHGDTAFAASYANLVNSAAKRSNATILGDAILSRLPAATASILKNFPPPELRPFLDHRKMTSALATRLLNTKTEALRLGIEPEKDLFSVLVGENAELSSSKMTFEEIKNQFGTITVAGEDTTANTLVWVLFVLSQNPQWQDQLREEVYQAFADNSDSFLDYDRLPFLNALIKETLRFYSTVPHTERISAEETVIPLSEPITTSTGKVLNEVKLNKGRYVTIAIACYQRLTSVWGADANEFKPSRWMQGEAAQGASLGPYANLLCFLGGPRTCIGWRFAILETQVVLCELIRKFTFSLPDDVHLQPAYAITLVPVDGDGKSYLPLRVDRLE
ncbi:cytochrome P450 [Crucibulum laeve]|uniref:Cytochrome P450 n=1 Tax=Crucibulum laeve TaxID=68775 RepID=A0A5C3LXB5_9AGAR|nr:cytochrome P450 [Crucibulum laeve]